MRHTALTTYKDFRTILHGEKAFTDAIQLTTGISFSTYAEFRNVFNTPTGIRAQNSSISQIYTNLDVATNSVLAKIGYDFKKPPTTYQVDKATTHTLCETALRTLGTEITGLQLLTPSELALTVFIHDPKELYTPFISPNARRPGGLLFDREFFYQNLRNSLFTHFQRNFEY